MVEKEKNKARQNSALKCKQNTLPFGKNDLSNLWCTFRRDNQGLNNIKVVVVKLNANMTSLKKQKALPVLGTSTNDENGKKIVNSKVNVVYFLV